MVLIISIQFFEVKDFLLANSLRADFCVSQIVNRVKMLFVYEFTSFTEINYTFRFQQFVYIQKWCDNYAHYL